jgi:hypothetical protein
MPAGSAKIDALLQKYMAVHAALDAAMTRLDETQKNVRRWCGLTTLWLWLACECGPDKRVATPVNPFVSCAGGSGG